MDKACKFASICFPHFSVGTEQAFCHVGIISFCFSNYVHQTLKIPLITGFIIIGGVSSSILSTTSTPWTLRSCLSDLYVGFWHRYCNPDVSGVKEYQVYAESHFKSRVEFWRRTDLMSLELKDVGAPVIYDTWSGCWDVRIFSRFANFVIWPPLCLALEKSEDWECRSGISCLLI